MSLRSPATSCRALSGAIAAMVVQLGLAMMPLGGESVSSGFTSATTNGTSGSIRHPLELSITITPASTKRGACSLDSVAPALKMAMSRPAGSATETSSTTTVVSPKGSSCPALLAEAKNRTSAASKLRSRSNCRTTWPTWPVAPTTPIATTIDLFPHRPWPRYRHLGQKRCELPQQQKQALLRA